MFKTLRVGLATVAVVGSYVYVLRPRMLYAGATDEETRRALPGDELVPTPRSVSTRAITIHAQAAAIWPWLVQMGQDRGGLYSYVWLEYLVGCEIENADRILPEYQHLQVGDVVRLTPPERYNLFFTVAVIDPGRALVLRTPLPPGGEWRENDEAGYPNGSWAFVLEPTSDQSTRLIVRWRSDYKPTVTGLFFNQYGLEPVHYLMERGYPRVAQRDAQRRGSGSRPPCVACVLVAIKRRFHESESRESTLTERRPSAARVWRRNWATHS